MSNIVTVAYSTEGNTDQRFLESIIKKTVEEVAILCNGLIETYDPIYLELPKKNEFVDRVISVAVEAFKTGINILFIHVDADDDDDKHVRSFKIDPAFGAVDELDISACKNLVAIIPVQMSESWMLADIELLKSEIGTTKSNQDLNLTRAPEKIANPKHLIEEVLRIAQEDLPRRRNKISILELYQPIGQKLSIDKLEQMPSFQKFRSAVEAAFRKLNYLQ